MQDVQDALLRAVDLVRAHLMGGDVAALATVLQPEIMRLVLVYRIHHAASQLQQQCQLQDQLQFPLQDQQLYHAIQPVLRGKPTKQNVRAGQLSQTAVQ